MLLLLLQPLLTKGNVNILDLKHILIQELQVNYFFQIILYYWIELNFRYWSLGKSYKEFPAAKCPSTHYFI